MKKILLFSFIAAMMVAGCKCKKTETATGTKADDNAPITTLFTGTDGIESYDVRIVYYPETQEALVTEGTNTYRLKQDIVASGFRYSNCAVELRGKGSEATMTFLDDSRPDIIMTEKK